MKNEIINAIKGDFFEFSPFNVALIDRDYRVLLANENFRKFFGNWEGKLCHEVCKESSRPCVFCKLDEVFSTGQMCVSFETGMSANSKSHNYVMHIAPVKDKNGEVAAVIELSLDVSENKCWQRDYHLIFEKVPNYITVIDRSYRIVRANENMRSVFGDSIGNYCYEAYKKRKSRCKNCPAAMTFADGREHQSTNLGKSSSGFNTNYIVVTTPLSKDDNGVSQVIEICTDITELTNLQGQINKTHTFYESLIKNSGDGIIAFDEHLQLQIFNDAAKKLLRWNSTRKPNTDILRTVMPEAFFSVDSKTDLLLDDEILIRNFAGDEVPVRINAFELKEKRHNIGRVAFLHDQRSILSLEKQKLDSERLAAISQTLSGLSYTVRDLLGGIEHGMSILQSGEGSNNPEEISQGWQEMQFNYTKTKKLVNDFLEFAVRKQPELRLIDPKGMLKTAAANFETIGSNKIKIKLSVDKNVKPVYLDSKAVLDCIQSLFQYSLESLKKGAPREPKEIRLKAYEENGVFIIEINDNGAGIDSNIERYIYSSFYISSNYNLNEIGILRVRKIISEHGGELEVGNSEFGGACFRLKFSRMRLELLLKEIYGNTNSEIEKSKRK